MNILDAIAADPNVDPALRRLLAQRFPNTIRSSDRLREAFDDEYKAQRDDERIERMEREDRL